MIFHRELAAKVLAGEKTVTRRLPKDNPRSPWWRGGCRYVPGKSSAVQPGRSKHSIGRVVVKSAELVELGHLDDAEARREGFTSAAEFEEAWKAMHGGYDPSAPVWRVEFHLTHMAFTVLDEIHRWERA